MARARIRDAQTNFTGGEFSPLMAARSDLAALYRSGAEKFANLAPLAQGGGRTRPALLYLATLAHTPAILVPFVFSLTQRYNFVFSDTRLDIYGVDGSLLTSLTSAPWTAAMLDRLYWATDGDTTILCHPDMAMQVVKRTGASSFTRSALAFEAGSAAGTLYQPYYKFVDPTITLTPGATTGTGISLVLSGAGGFVAGHVGVIIRHKKKQILVQTVTDANNATGDVLETLADTSAATDWDEAVFSPVRGYAHSAIFYKNRLGFGGTKSRPTGVYFSKVGAYFNFDVGTVQDNEAIWEGVQGLSTEIRGMLGIEQLLLFGDRSFYAVPITTANPFTPKNFAAREQQPYGISYVRPASFDGAGLFVHETGANVREALYNDTDQKYSGDSVSLLAEHLISSPTGMDVLTGATNKPEQYALAVNGDGNLSVFLSLRQQKIGAWVPWTTNGTFKSLAVAGKEIFVLVERAIAGGTKWTLEKFDDDRAPLDCMLRVTSGAATKTFAGFTHLAGKEVQVATKGHPLGAYTVDGSGVITLDDLAPSVTEIEAGYGFEQRIRPMPCDFDLPEGAARGLFKRLIRVLAMVDRSLSFTLNGTEVLLTFQGDDFTVEPTTKTGQLEFRVLGVVNREAQFDLVVADPVKVTILGLMREVSLNG